MKLSRSPFLSLALTVSLISLQACVTEDQQTADEALSYVGSEGPSALPPEATADLQSEKLSHKVEPALTPDDIAADNDPMKIGFATAEWSLSDTAVSRIADVATKLTADPAIRLKVEGHCDERGSDAYNQDLSNKRARAVADALIAQGVAAKRLSVKGYGRKRSLVKGVGEAVYSHNRRVEMIFEGNALPGPE